MTSPLTRERAIEVLRGELRALLSHAGERYQQALVALAALSAPVEVHPTIATLLERADAWFNRNEKTSTLEDAVYAWEKAGKPGLPSTKAKSEGEGVPVVGERLDQAQAWRADECRAICSDDCVTFRRCVLARGHVLPHEDASGDEADAWWEEQIARGAKERP